MQTDNTLSNIFSGNYLVTAWAMEEKEQPAKASAWLEEQVKQNPGDRILVWAKQVFDKKQIFPAGINDATVRILQRLMEVEK